MYLLDKKDHYKVMEIIEKYKSEHVEPYINGFLERPENGKVFVDDPVKPTIAYFDYTYNPYLHVIIGNFEKEEKYLEFIDFIKVGVLPDAKKIGHKRLAFRSFPHSICKKLQSEFVNNEITVMSRKNFKFNKEKFLTFHENWQDKIIHNTVLKKIDREFLNKCNDESLYCDLNENWLGKENYLKDGIGYALMKNNTVAAFCFSFIASDSFQEVNIETNKEFRRKGFASIVAAAFIEECVKTGKTPIWECDADNTASINLAKSLGFKEVSEFEEIYIDLVFHL